MANGPVITGTKPNPLDGGSITDPAADNKSVADKLAAQDIAAQLTSTDVKPAEDALDALAQEAEARLKKEAEEKAKADAAAAAAGAPKVEPKKEGAPDPQKTPDVETPEQKAEREKTEAATKEQEALSKKAEEIFKDAPGLAPNAAPKSHEAFSAVKVKAAQEISKLQTSFEAAQKELAELKKNTGKPTAEFEAQAKELQELREKLAKFDVEFDPKFKEYDGRIERARDFIYEQLKRLPGVDEKTIEEIKKIGGPERLDIETFFKDFKDPTTKRLVESKMADILSIQYDKNQAIKSTKGNITEYLKEREGASVKQAEQRLADTNQQLGGLVEKFEWFTPKDATTGDDTAKKLASEHNAFLEEVKGDMASAAKDESPFMKAVLIAAYGQLRNIKRDYASIKAENESLTKSNAELTEKYDKLKRAGSSRLKDSSAPTGGNTPIQPKQDIFTTKAADSLDALAKQITEQRAATGGNQ